MSPHRRALVRTAAVLLTAALVSTACGDDGDAPATTTAPASTAAPASSSSVASPASTTTVSGATTTRAATSSSAPVTTAASTTRPPATTASAVPSLPLRGDGIGPVVIGRDSANDVINAVSGVFGTATGDQATACESGADRTVQWSRGPLIAVFSRGTFVGYLYGRAGASGNPALATATGLRVGSTRADLQRVYPTNLQVFASSIGTEYLAPDGLRGTLSANTASATIETIGAGDICAFR